MLLFCFSLLYIKFDTFLYKLHRLINNLIIFSFILVKVVKMLKVLLIVVTSFTLISCESKDSTGFTLMSSKDSTCVATATPYMYILEVAANLFEKLLICGQLVDVAGATDNFGRTYITYKAKIKFNSEASK